MSVAPVAHVAPADTRRDAFMAAAEAHVVHRVNESWGVATEAETAPDAKGADLSLMDILGVAAERVSFMLSMPALVDSVLDCMCIIPLSESLWQLQGGKRNGKMVSLTVVASRHPHGVLLLRALYVIKHAIRMVEKDVFDYTIGGECGTADDVVQRVLLPGNAAARALEGAVVAHGFVDDCFKRRYVV